MPSIISNCFRSLLCFKRKSHVEFLDGAHVTASYGFSDSKDPHYSSHSISSEVVEKKELTPSDIEDEPVSSSSTLAVFQNDKISKSNVALLVTSKGVYTLTQEFPYPSFAHGNEVIIRNRAVGLNPIDWQSVEYQFCLPEYPWITGREMSGVVEAIGSEVKGLSVGDRVWTSTYYRDRRAGCFQEAVTVPAHTVLPMPTNLSFEESATLGVAGLTAAMTLWKWLEVPLPPSISTAQSSHPPNTSADDKYLLIWGGAATTGQYAIQIARLGGIKTICVASTKTSSLCLSLGASHVVARDGKSTEEIIAEIRAIVGDSITMAVDLVGTKTAEHCLKAVSQQRNVLFAPLAMISKDASIPTNVQIQIVEMKRFVLDPENAIYAKRLNDLMESGRIKVPALEVVGCGLAMVEEGLERVKIGDRSGKKLVVTIP